MLAATSVVGIDDQDDLPLGPAILILFQGGSRLLERQRGIHVDGQLAVLGQPADLPQDLSVARAVLRSSDANDTHADRFGPFGARRTDDADEDSPVLRIFSARVAVSTPKEYR